MVEPIYGYRFNGGGRPEVNLLVLAPSLNCYCSDCNRPPPARPRCTSDSSEQIIEVVRAIKWKRIRFTERLTRIFFLLIWRSAEARFLDLFAGMDPPGHYFRNMHSYPTPLFTYSSARFNRKIIVKSFQLVNCLFLHGLLNFNSPPIRESQR